MSNEQIDWLQKKGHTLHLKTQRDQPYGSVRKCCEVCGVMIYGEHAPLWTDDEQE